MRRLTYYIASTIDGFIAGPDGEFDFFPFEGDVAAAILAEYPETIPIQAREALGLTGVANKHFDRVLMGRGTYEPALAIGITSPYPQLKQYVFSRTQTGCRPRGGDRLRRSGAVRARSQAAGRDGYLAVRRREAGGAAAR